MHRGENGPNAKMAEKLRTYVCVCDKINAEVNFAAVLVLIVLLARYNLAPKRQRSHIIMFTRKKNERLNSENVAIFFAPIINAAGMFQWRRLISFYFRFGKRIYCNATRRREFVLGTREQNANKTRAQKSNTIPISNIRFLKVSITTFKYVSYIK